MIMNERFPENSTFETSNGFPVSDSVEGMGTRDEKRFFPSDCEVSETLIPPTREVRLESVHTSPFLLGLATALEKFLDILGESFELSPEKGAANFELKRPKTFQGAGFGVTFPFCGGLGVFLIAERGGILPGWFANPGIAGKSRIFLLANELERLFAPENGSLEAAAALAGPALQEIETLRQTQPEFQPQNVFQAECEFPPEAGGQPETAASQKDSCQEGPNPTDSVVSVPKSAVPPRSFYETHQFFYGRIETLEKLFAALPLEDVTDFRSFSIRKFDGREGSAWMLGPLSSPDVFYANTQNVPQTLPQAGILKPVRSLEAVTIESLPETDRSGDETAGLSAKPAAKESASASDAEPLPKDAGSVSEVETPPPTDCVSPTATSEPVAETDQAEEGIPSIRETVSESRAEEEKGAEGPDFSDFPRLIYRFHFRANLHSPRQRAEREERILSQIRYAHPANTQIWRAHSMRQIEQFSAELQALLAVASWGGNAGTQTASQPAEALPATSVSVPVPMTSIVETQILAKDSEELFAPIQVIDLWKDAAISESEFQPLSVTCDFPGNWTENAFVVAKTFEPPAIPQGFTAESLLEPESKEEGEAEGGTEPETESVPLARTPFRTDFSEVSDLEVPQIRTAPVDAKQVMGIPVSVSILLGRAKLPVSELLEWKVGTILNLGQKTSESAEVFVNGGCAGNGFPVEYENHVGVLLEKMRCP